MALPGPYSGGKLLKQKEKKVSTELVFDITEEAKGKKLPLNRLSRGTIVRMGTEKIVYMIVGFFNKNSSHVQLLNLEGGSIGQAYDDCCEKYEIVKDVVLKGRTG